MMKIFNSRFFAGILLLITLNGALAAQEYSVSKIPEELKKNASAVVRKQILNYTINDDGSELIITSEYAVTVLDKSGDFINSFAARYDASSKLTGVKAVLYDADGDKIKKISKSDFSDYGVGGLYNMYDDTRALVYNPVPVAYPYTIEYEYTFTEKEFLILPSWKPVEDNMVSLEKAVLNINVNKDYSFNFKEFNLQNGHTERLEKDRKIYTWTLNNYTALDDEPFSPEAANYLPLVIMAPKNFSLKGYSGSFASWNDFGKWAGDLIRDRDILPAACAQTVHQLTDTLQDPYEKIQNLYRYLQKNTRYVSIQLGIGGYQPFDAASVYENGYGDCKALSNYMKALLKEAGITSYYTLVNAGNGKPDIKTDFPSQQFNHAILCVPIGNDTTWLECTSPVDPPGYIAGFTDDRHVLVVSDDGGTLLKTRDYPTGINRQDRKADVVLNPGLDMQVRVNTTYRGGQYGHVQRYLNESREDQKKALLKGIDIPEFSIRDFTISDTLVDREPQGLIGLDLIVNHYVKSSGDRIFLPLNLMNRFANVPRSIKERHSDVWFSSSFSDTDSIIYTIPNGYKVEYLPENIDISYDFGAYHSETVKQGDKLVYVRKISRNKGLYPGETYPDVIDFYRQIVKADNCKALLLKK